MLGWQGSMKLLSCSSRWSLWLFSITAMPFFSTLCQGSPVPFSPLYARAALCLFLHFMPGQPCAFFSTLCQGSPVPFSPLYARAALCLFLHFMPGQPCVLYCIWSTCSGMSFSPCALLCLSGIGFELIPLKWSYSLAMQLARRRWPPRL